MVKSSFVINLEYAALCSACAVVNAIPYSCARGLVRCLAWTMVHIVGFKRARTLKRIRDVFPDITPADTRRIATNSLANLLLTAIEMIKMPRFDRAWMDEHVVNGRKSHDLLKDLMSTGKGVVIMVPHSGNWFMAAWALAHYGIPLVAIAARQRNPKITGWLSRHYGSIEVLFRNSHQTLVQIKERLDAGRAFAIMPDLRIPKRDVEVPFLGGTANVSHAGAMFALRSGCPIVVAAMSRDEKGRHVINYIETLHPDFRAHDQKAEAVRLTCEALGMLNQAVMKNPDDWFWYNKRWILEPVKEK